ncbi:MAG: tryptophan synthase subunit alpha [Thermodesulfobacteriota bacterium]
MSRIDHTFERLKNMGRVALIPFIIAGDADLKTTELLILKMVESGVDLIELGVPCSDPLADGPTIRSAHQRALKNGISLREVFQLTERLKGISTPLVLMTYLNPVFYYGLKNFAEDCKRCGIDGVVIPDLSPEEAGMWMKEARKSGLDTIFLIAPNSSIRQIEWVSRFSSGFIYYASNTGGTGMREKLPEGLRLGVWRIKEQSKKPVAVGFGISNPEQAKAVSRFADGVIVGSAIVKTIEKNLDNPNLIDRVGDFVFSFTNVLSQ